MFHILVRINHVTRCFFFQQGEPKKKIYRIGYDKMQGDSLSKGLLAEGWTKVFGNGNWLVTVNEKSIEDIKTSTVRDGIIKHNRVIMYIFGGILSYFSITTLFFLTIFIVDIFNPDSKVEVVDSPYWILTYLYFSAIITTLGLGLYSVIKIHKTNKELIKENTNRKKLPSESLAGGKLPNAEEKLLKRSGQLIVKRKFGWMYASDRLEAWLEEMEEKGFNLHRVNKAGTTFYFIIGHPRKMSYCADYQNIADEGYFDIHRETGWKSVFFSYGSLQKWSIWSCEYADGEAKPQIYSDKTNKLKHAKRIAISYTCMFLPLVISYLLLIGVRIGLMVDGKLDKGQFFNMLVMLLVILSFGSYSIRTWLYYQRLKKGFQYKL